MNIESLKGKKTCLSNARVSWTKGAASSSDEKKVGLHVGNPDLELLMWLKPWRRDCIPCRRDAVFSVYKGKWTKFWVTRDMGWSKHSSVPNAWFSLEAYSSLPCGTQAEACEFLWLKNRSKTWVLHFQSETFVWTSFPCFFILLESQTMAVLTARSRCADDCVADQNVSWFPRSTRCQKNNWLEASMSLYIICQSCLIRDKHV